jgi:pimeloyl-ACP methyl ester carboxylesterase
MTGQDVLDRVLYGGYFLSMPLLDLPSGSIHYLQQGNGPDLVLLHNGFDSSRTWENLLPHLAATHRVTAYDRAGCGGSDPVALAATSSLPARQNWYRCWTRSGSAAPC